jgi:hypothetical protein
MRSHSLEPTSPLPTPGDAPSFDLETDVIAAIDPDGFLPGMMPPKNRHIDASSDCINNLYQSSIKHIFHSLDYVSRFFAIYSKHIRFLGAIQRVWTKWSRRDDRATSHGRPSPILSCFSGCAAARYTVALRCAGGIIWNEDQDRDPSSWTDVNFWATCPTPTPTARKRRG